MKRRDFLKTGATAFSAAAMGAAKIPAHAPEPIDRAAVVARHNLLFTKSDVLNTLTVGNGNFAFGVDITGAQTFQAHYNAGIGLSTMSHWGWHNQKNPHGYSNAAYPRTLLKNAAGKEVPYLLVGATPELQAQANFLYALTTRINLGRIGLALARTNGKPAALSDLASIRQTLDLWTGIIDSEFSLDGHKAHVQTCCHGMVDQVAMRIVSPLLKTGQLKVQLAFPYASNAWNGNGADWTQPGAFETHMTRSGGRRANFFCKLDATTYRAALAWRGAGSLSQDGPHAFTLDGSNTSTLEFVCAFAPRPPPANLPDFAESRAASAAMWRGFWTTGGAIDLSESKDARWHELERRIILSRYLTRINCCGTLPPQETGLTCNSWFGKFHLEMHWWHAAHFALWGHVPLLERSLPFYQRILPHARVRAQAEGCRGARWPKSCGPSGSQAPQDIEATLLWQQPHQLMYAQLCYQAQPNARTLRRFAERVFQTADFMASFVCRSNATGRYQLGPPAYDAAEMYGDFDHQWNLNFELAYWRWALGMAQSWRKRLGLPPKPEWEHIRSNLPPLTVKNGLYVAAQTAPHTFTKPGRAASHPCMVAPLGMLDGGMVDRPTMARTLAKIMKVWNWGSTWGWDYPLLAMTAGRLGQGPQAIDILLMDESKNTYLPNGHNFQESILPVYLPGNGGLLYAVALMAAGWPGAPSHNAPGFPQDGSWTVRHEGLLPAL